VIGDLSRPPTRIQVFFLGIATPFLALFAFFVSRILEADERRRKRELA
jgi:hypothetical protein